LPGWWNRIFRHNIALGRGTHVIGAAKLADQEFELLLVLFAGVLKDKAYSDGMM
jgi:hypothetical protein